MTVAWLMGGWRLRASTGLGGLVLVLLIIGWVVPWSARWDEWAAMRSPRANHGASEPSGHGLRAMTLNLDSRSTDLEQLRATLARHAPDLIALQEAPVGTEKILPAGWSSVRRGDLLIACRWPVTEHDVIWREKTPERWPRPIGLIAQVDHPHGVFCCATLHPLTPRFGLLNMLDRRTILAVDRVDRWEDETRVRWNEHRRMAAAVQALDGPVIVMGDFNAPVESRIYQTQWGQYHNAFSRCGWGRGHTIRIEVRSWELAARIDHILTSPNWRSHQVWLGEPVGSEHLPVFAQLSRAASAQPLGVAPPPSSPR
jgi:hypothetical protein